MRRVLAISISILAFTLAQALPAQATTVNVSGNAATGISDLVVGLNHYDATFVGSGGDTYNSVYGSPPTFNVAYSDAADIAAAIISALNALTPNVPDIAGTSLVPDFSGFLIPESVTASVVAFYATNHQKSGTSLYYSPADLYTNVNRDLSLNIGYVWVSVAPVAAVPLPTALPVFASGLGVMGLLGWRRKRKAKPAA